MITILDTRRSAAFLISVAKLIFFFLTGTLMRRTRILFGSSSDPAIAPFY